MTAIRSGGTKTTGASSGGTPSAAGFRSQVRRGTAAEWASANPVLDPGEIGLETDTGVVKAGDGTTAWASLDPLFDTTYAPIAGASEQYRLPNTAAKLATIAAAPPARLRVLSFGDSYAQKVYSQIWATLVGVTGGPAGMIGSQSSPILGGISINSTTGTVTGNTTDFTRWPSGATETFATGATRTYGAAGSTFRADTIKVYYALEPGAGTFKIQVDGVDAPGHTNISAAGTLGQLGVATVTTTASTHTVTIVNLTGTVTILAVGYENSTVSGVVSLNVSQGGIALNSPTSTAWSNFQAFLADQSPDLMLMEVKEDSSYFAAALSTLFATTAAGAPGMDVIGIGSTPVASGDADQVTQNQQLRTACEAAGYVYWDSYAPFGSYAKLDALGWEGDGVHVTAAADQFRGMLMLRDTGLLSSHGRNVWQGGIRVPALSFGRLQDHGSVGSVTPEQTFGLDLQIRTGRRIDFATNSGTVVALIDTSGNASYMPDRTRIGSSTGPALWQLGQGRIAAVRGDSLSSTADMQARTFVIDPATQAAASGAVTCDLADRGAHVLTLTGNVTSFAFTNAPNSGTYIEVHFVQDGTGSRTLAGVNSSIKWSGGSAPTLTTTAGRRDIFVFRQTGNGGSAVFHEIGRSMNVG